jgi:hypothetical protein
MGVDVWGVLGMCRRDITWLCLGVREWRFGLSASHRSTSPLCLLLMIGVWGGYLSGPRLLGIPGPHGVLRFRDVL